jgi:hypothetical protein
MTLPTMNYWVILLAAVSSFALGGLWYSPVLFGKIWGRESGAAMAGDKAGHPAKVFGVSFAFALLAAFAFAFLLGPNPGMMNALPLGLTIGIGFVAASFGINYQFASRSFKLWLIDGGYHVSQFAIYGLVFGWLG